MKSMTEKRATQRIAQPTRLDHTVGDIQELPCRGVQRLDLANPLGHSMENRPGRLPLLGRVGCLHLVGIPATASLTPGASGPAAVWLSLLPMTSCYAYLVVERKRYPIEAAGEANASGSANAKSAPTADDSFPDRLRSVLDAAAKAAGYGSLDRLMGSVRVRNRSTPSRALHVQGLLNAGLLKEDAEISKMVNGAVPDPAWEILGAIHPGHGRGQRIPEPGTKAPLQAKTRFIDSWSLSVHADDGVTPIDVDPTRAPGSALPVALIAQTLEKLSSEGWAVVHISEDRSIDDQASASYVIRQRVLLRR
jgi:hypothetical protein